MICPVLKWVSGGDTHETNSSVTGDFKDAFYGGVCRLAGRAINPGRGGAVAGGL